MMRHILIDHSTLGRFCGFSEISENYGRILAHTEVPDIHFTYLVPQRFVGHFGDNVSYVSCEHPVKDLDRLGYDIDIWHSTSQLFKFRKRFRHTWLTPRGKGLEAFIEPGRKEREIRYAGRFDYGEYTKKYIELYRKILNNQI